MKEKEKKIVEKCIFCKIVAKQSPARIVYEDNKVIAFHDLYKVKKVHFLVVPKKCIRMFQEIEEEKDKQLMGLLMVTAKKVAEQENLRDGYRIVINNGKHGCQHIYHLHIHVVGGEPCFSPESYGSWKYELNYEEPSKRQKDKRKDEFMEIVSNKKLDKVIEENKEAIAFYDPLPLALTHFLVAPKKHIANFQDIENDDINMMGSLMIMAKNVAKLQNLNGNPKYGGYRVVINNGEHGRQSIDYLHVQVLGGEQLNWPPY